MRGKASETCGAAIAHAPGMLPLRWGPSGDANAERATKGVRMLFEWRVPAGAASGPAEMQRVASFVAERLGAEAYCSLADRRGLAVARFDSEAQMAEVSQMLWTLTGRRPRMTPVIGASETEHVS